MKFKSWIGHRAREMGLYLVNSVRPHTDRTAIFCVDGPRGGFASGLRGHLIADELRKFGWRVIVIPHQLELAQRLRIIKREKPDILFLQKSRHPLNHPKYYPGLLCVFDLDDADFVDPDHTERVIECAKGCQAAIAGSTYVAEFLKKYNAQVEIVWTGSTPLTTTTDITKSDPPIITWACSDPLGYPREAELVKNVLLSLTKNTKSKFQFWLIGVKEISKAQPYLQPLIDDGINCQIFPFLPYEELLTTLKPVSIGLAPLLPEESPYSAGKSFGKILAYLNCNIAIIASDTADHPLFFEHNVNGFLAKKPDEWRDTIEFLLNNPTNINEIARQGRQDYLSRLSIIAAAKKIDDFFSAQIDKPPLNSNKSKAKIKKLAYIAGPGDVIDAYHHWEKSQVDPTEVSMTYSGQFYSVTRRLGLSAYVISSHARPDHFNNEWLTIVYKSKFSLGYNGVIYHLREIAYIIWLMSKVIHYRADLVVVSNIDHWWLLSFLKLASIEIVPSLHCTFWPKKHRPVILKQKFIYWLNGIFWRFIPSATICISPECERQVLEIANNKVHGPLLQARPLYHQGYLDTIAPINWKIKPFKILYAGRMERNKGIFDLIEVMARLELEYPGQFVIEVCGDGQHTIEFCQEIDRRRFDNRIFFLGKLDHEQMYSAYARAHAIIVPTRAEFAEGLNKVVVEGVLAGRPVIVTDICPAAEVLPNSVIIVGSGDIDAMVLGLTKLAMDFSFYQEKCAFSKHESAPFYDPQQSWGGALDKAISFLS